VALEPQAVYSAGRYTPDTPPQLPPTALAPAFPGEPVRADFHFPTDPRGTGDSWPAESRLPRSDRPARCPLAYAWPLLANAKVWPYAVNGYTGTLEPAQAIAAVLA